MKYGLITLFLLVASGVFGQTTKTVEPTLPGTIHQYFTTTDLTTVTTLTVKGKMDARDFAFLRDRVKGVTTLNMALVSILAYTGSEGTLQGEVTTYPANELPDFAFYNPILLSYKPELKSVTLPATLASIGDQAFYFCWNLTSLGTLPNNLKKIGAYAFYGCYALSSFTVSPTHTRFATDKGILYNKAKDTLFVCPNAKTGAVDIPATVKHIDQSAFENCYNLTAITLPSSLQSTGSYAFAYCSGISGNLTLPGTLQSLSDGAFYGCYNLTGTVSFPASLTNLGSYCFFESNNIQAFHVNASNTRFSSTNGMLFSKQTDTLFICPAGKTGAVSIPASVKLLGSHAFYGCTQLTGTITIPQGVDYISYYAFYGCTGLAGFSVDPQNSYFSADNGILYSKNKDRLLYCPTTYSGAFTIPSTVASLDPGAFHSCTGINGSIYFPEAMSWIGEYAFYNCPGITGFEVAPSNPWYSANDGVLLNKNADTLYICPLYKAGNYSLPATIKHIGTAAFYGCTYITGMEAGEGLQSVGNSAFSYCTSLQNVELPSSIHTIGYSAFYSCSALSSFSINKQAPPVIDYYTFDLANQAGAQLFVPTSSKQLYEQAPYWQNFSTISEQSFATSAPSVNTSGVNLSITADGMLVTGLQPGELIEVYSTAGKKLLSIRASKSEQLISFQAKGIFILHAGQSFKKFIR